MPNHRDETGDARRTRPGAHGWADYYAATQGRPPREPLVRAVDLLGRVGDALDLGCGAGNDTRYLLERGFRVTAVDADPDSFAGRQASNGPQLWTIQRAFSDISLDPARYDLVSAQLALPFSHPDAFPALFTRIVNALRSGGIFTGDLFGNRDGWNVAESGMTFHSRQEAEALFTGLDLLEFNEVEEQRALATGEPKQWHRFQIIARRPRERDETPGASPGIA
jgi:SAM-dependent methyltransferase